MSMGWNYVSELQPPTGLLFIPQLIYGAWRMISIRGNSWFVHLSALIILATESSGREKEELAKGIMNLALRSIFGHTCKWCFICHSLTTWGLRLSFPSEGRRAADFYRPWKFIVSTEFEPANFGSNVKHANHYTTEATYNTQVLVSAAQ
jgi:hypothetical protein